MKFSLAVLLSAAIAIPAAAAVSNKPQEFDLFFNAQVQEYCGMVLDKDTADIGFSGNYVSDATKLTIYHNGLAASRDNLTLKLDDVSTGGFYAAPSEVDFEVTTQNKGVTIMNSNRTTEVVGDLTGDVEIRATLSQDELSYPAGSHTVTVRYELRCKR